MLKWIITMICVAGLTACGSMNTTSSGYSSGQNTASGSGSSENTLLYQPGEWGPGTFGGGAGG